MSEGIHTAPKPFVFVLMPFSKDFDDVYKVAIKPACERAGAYCERVDEQHFDGSMLQRIYNQIAKADFVIADMSGKNPNVFYEVGYSHAIDKRVILVTNSSSDIPFDLKHHPHIVYASLSQLSDELEARSRWAVDNPKELSMFTERRVALYVDRTEVLGNPLVEVEPFGSAMNFAVAICNVAGKKLAPVVFQCLIEVEGDIQDISVSHKDFESGIKLTVISVGDGLTRFLLDDSFRVLPNSWKRLAIRLGARVGGEEILKRSLRVKLLMEDGTLEFPFSVYRRPSKKVL